MSARPPQEMEPKLRLEQITTVWSMLSDPAQFIMRYAPAIQRYFAAMISNRHDAEEAIQDFLVRVMKTGFTGADIGRGRFRDYLRTAVRNAALAQLRRSSTRTRIEGAVPATAEVSSPEGQSTVEQQWVDEWRQCVLDRAWRALERYQNRNPAGGLPHTMLRMVVDHPHDDSKALAARAAALTGETLTPESFRQRLSRARRVFARLLVQEIAETLKAPTPGEVEQELIDLGLIPFVRDFLPGDWRTGGVLPHLA